MELCPLTFEVVSATIRSKTRATSADQENQHGSHDSTRRSTDDSADVERGQTHELWERELLSQQRGSSNTATNAALLLFLSAWRSLKQSRADHHWLVIRHGQASKVPMVAARVIKQFSLQSGDCEHFEGLCVELSVLGAECQPKGGASGPNQKLPSRRML